MIEHRLVRLKWIILSGILLLSFTAFIERLATSVVAVQMMSELGLSQVQIGWLFAAFVGGYTACQFPGGLLGLHFGARRILFVSALIGAMASVATAIAPLVATGGFALIATLLGARLLLGVAQAPLYPVSSGVLQTWFPPEQWALVMGLIVSSIGLGAAVTPPAIAWLMHALGWQVGLCIATIPGALAAVAWIRYAREPTRDNVAARLAVRPRSWNLLRAAIGLAVDRNVIALTASYLLENSVVYLITFWSFLYLVQERHFSVLEGGWLAGLPFVIGAFGGVVGGRWCDRCCDRFGPRWGVRIIPLVVLPSAAALLYLTVTSSNPYTAVTALTGCYSCLQMTEGSYWCAAMRVGRDHTMAATGVLNTGGNLGGLLAMPIVGYLSGLHNWWLCFILGVACLIGSTALWLFIDPTRDRPGRPISFPAPAPVQ